MSITNYLDKIKTAVYGREVRGAIHDAIKECYDEAAVNHGNANMEVALSRGNYNTLNDRLNNADRVQAQTNAQLSETKQELSSQLDKKANEIEVVKKGYGTLNDFDEDTRALLQGLGEGETNVNAVLGEKNVTKRNINDNEVCFNHLNVRGNLINPKSVTYDTVVNTSGDEEKMDGYYVTDYIGVTKDDYYSINNTLATTGAWYDDNKSFVSKFSDTHTEKIGSNYKVKSPSNASFVRLNFKHSVVRPSSCAFYYGLVSSCEYKTMDMVSVNGDNIQEKSISYFHMKDAVLKPTNLINKDTVKFNVMLDKYGNEVEASNPNIWTTDYIEVEDTKVYSVRKLLALPGLWYDCNKKVISWLPTNATNPTTITPPEGACYCRWTGDASCPVETTMFIKGDTYPSYYVPYTSHDRFEVNGLDSQGDYVKHNGKKYLVLGDSISVNTTHTQVFYHDYVSEHFGFIKTNKAVSGSGWCVSSNLNDSLTQVISRLDEKYDLITIFAGTNDFGRTQDGVNSKPFGNYGDATLDTYCGSVYYTLNQLIEQQQGADIIVITPLPRSNKDQANTYGKTLKDYRDVLVKTCEDLSIPCIDLYKESGIYVFNSKFKDEFIPDGLHLNHHGHKKISNNIIDAVKKHISI